MRKGRGKGEGRKVRGKLAAYFVLEKSKRGGENEGVSKRVPANVMSRGHCPHLSNHFLSASCMHILHATPL